MKKCGIKSNYYVKNTKLTAQKKLCFLIFNTIYQYVQSLLMSHSINIARVACPLITSWSIYVNISKFLRCLSTRGNSINRLLLLLLCISSIAFSNCWQQYEQFHHFVLDLVVCWKISCNRRHVDWKLRDVIFNIRYEGDVLVYSATVDFIIKTQSVTMEVIWKSKNM